MQRCTQGKAFLQALTGTFLPHLRAPLLHALESEIAIPTHIESNSLAAPLGPQPRPLACRRLAWEDPYRGLRLTSMAVVAQAQQLVRAVQAPSMRAAQPHALAAPLRTPTTPQAATHASLAARIAAAAQRRAGSGRRRRAAPVAAAPAAVEELTIQPVRVIEGHVKLPGSKSLSNRILLLAALAEGTTTVENILVSWRDRGTAA